MQQKDYYIEYEANPQEIESNSQSLSLDQTVELVQQGLSKVGQVAQSIEHMYEMRQKTKQIKAITKVQMATTVAKYKLCQEFLDSTFKERREALHKCYSVLDAAVAAENNEQILAALGSISDIVSTSPLSELQHMAQIFDDTSVPLLDF